VVSAVDTGDIAQFRDYYFPESDSGNKRSSIMSTLLHGSQNTLILSIVPQILFDIEIFFSSSRRSYLETPTSRYPLLSEFKIQIKEIDMYFVEDN